MDKLIVRKMKLGDHVGLKNNIFTDMDQAQIEENVLNNVKDMKDNGNWIYLVAELKNEVVGTTYMELGKSSINKHVAELFSVVTSKNHLRKGICRALIEKAVALAAENNIEMITLTVREGTVADTVYQNLGFRDYGNLKNGIKDGNKYFNQKYYYLKIGQ